MTKPLCLALVLTTGCSWFMVRGPDTPPQYSGAPQPYPRCTSSMVWPVVDAAFTVLFAAVAVTAITNPRERMEGDPSQANEVASASIFALGAGLSGWIGYRRVSRCHDAREQFAQYPNGIPTAAPAPYGTSPSPYAPPIQVPYSGPAPTQPPPTPATPASPAQPAPAALGTEGDVCASPAECATGLTCTNNVCIRPPARR